jgi:FKBP-type peptidyl-prolyl cis-trans isomerase
MLKLGLNKFFNGRSILFTGMLLTMFSFLLSGCLEDSNVDELNQEREEALLKQLGTDTLLIKEYLAQNNITNAKRTPAGLFYVEQVVGPGAQAQISNYVKVHYTLSSLSGDLIETTAGGQPAQFLLSNTVAGFREGITKMKVGGKSRLFVPSLLGYQDQPDPRQNKIKPNMVLVFDVELVEAI